MTSRNLEDVPKFEPDEQVEIPSFDPVVKGFEVVDVDHLLSNERANFIKSILSEFIAPHVREKTDINRFFKEALLAIAIYQHKCRAEPSYSRTRARQVLSEAAEAAEAAIEAFDKVQKWPELSLYIENVFLSRVSLRDEGDERSIDQIIADRLNKKDHAHDNYATTISPRTIARQLEQLQPFLALAAERVVFQPGDAQRNDVARCFADNMVHAWILGTGKVPTYSALGPRSRSPSPFAALLTAINQKIFDQIERSINDFSDHGRLAIKKRKIAAGQPIKKRKRKD